MTKKKIIRSILLVVGVGVVLAAGVGFYMFNMPHRDVQALNADYSFSASNIVEEYLTDAAAANDKYLDEEGESKILEVTGLVASITEDFNDQKVILLKSDTDKAGVNCTFTSATNAQADRLTVGQIVTIKGAIRSGAAYDEDLEMYEHVNMTKCSVVKPQ